MSKNILVISVDIRETRVALIENGIIAELHIERRGKHQGTVGNVVLGKVTRVLPGLQAAFIDIGQERAAFLHVEDLIRPDDFDAYLAGGRKAARDRDEAALPAATGDEELDAEAEAELDEAPAAAAGPTAGTGTGTGEASADIEGLGGGATTAAGAGSATGGPSTAADGVTSVLRRPGSVTRDAIRADVDVDVDVDVSGDAVVDRTSGLSLAGSAHDEEDNEDEDDDELGDEDAAVDSGDLPATSSDDVARAADDASRPSLSSLTSLPQALAETLSDPDLAARADADEDEDGDGDEDADDGGADHDDEEDVDAGPPESSPVPVPERRPPREGELDAFASSAEWDSAPTRKLSGDEFLASVLAPRAARAAAPPSTGDALPLPATTGDRSARLPQPPPGRRPEARRGADFSDDLPGFTISDPNEPMPRAPSPPRTGGARDDRGRQGRRSSRHRGRGRDRDRDTFARGGERSDRGGGGGGGGGDRGRRDGGRDRDRGDRGGRSSVPGRISKSTPIRDVVREGQEIIVQITKEPIGTKGARVSSHISLPGRYVVYMPTVDHVGISKRIGSEKERSRLRDAIDGMKPPSGGLIVRTVAEGLTKKQLKQDVGYLVRLWGEIAKKKETAKAPDVLMSELDLVLKTARDLFTDEVHQIVIDDRHQYDRLCRFVEMFAPDRLKDISLYQGAEPIFDEYGIEDEIARALSRKVPLPSGGYLIIDQAEALTAIDVNTGRFVGKGSKDMEETILKTNLEAVNEIAYQLRFRNIGGLIILDLIDMEKAQNREKVRRTLEELLHKDKAKTTLNRISDLGLIEMTRKRTRESLGRLMHEPCFYCDGTGQLQSKETIAYEILREIRRKRGDLPGYTIVVNAHPAVADLLTGPEKMAVADAENRYMRKIAVVARKEYHLEQFDLEGR